MLKIAHMGAYGMNLGDTVAIDNIRIQLEKELDSEVEWIPINLMDFHAQKNSIEWSKKEFATKLSGCAALIIGGGGLLEGSPQENYGSGWKLPFNSEILSEIKIPIYVFSVGVNHFRGKQHLSHFSDHGKSGLASLVEKAALFSVRNDGSLEKILELLPPRLHEKIKEYPDPGLIYDYENTQKNSIEPEDFKVFQPAHNAGADVILGRFLTDENFTEYTHLPIDLNLTIFAHTPKDYKYFQMTFPENAINFTHSLIDHQRHAGIPAYKTVLGIYKHVGLSVAMRGHGQMIALGLNIPSLYFSTQDKVLNFSQQHGLMNYNIDVQDENWRITIEEKFNRIQNDPQYLANWYNIRNQLIAKFKEEFREACIILANKLEKA